MTHQPSDHEVIHTNVSLLVKREGMNNGDWKIIQGLIQVFTLHVADLNLIPGTIYGLPSTARIDPQA